MVIKTKLNRLILTLSLFALLAVLIVAASPLELSYEREFSPYSNEPGSGAEMEVEPYDMSSPCSLYVRYYAVNNTIVIRTANIINATVRVDAALEKYAPLAPDYYYTLVPDRVNIILSSEGPINITFVNLSSIPVSILYDGAPADFALTDDGIALYNVTAGEYDVSFVDGSGGGTSGDVDDAAEFDALIICGICILAVLLAVALFPPRRR